MEWKTQLCEMNYDHRERRAVDRVIQNEWLTMGDESAAFEMEFAKLIEHPNQGIFVSSATAGLHLILMALGIRHGDEVIVPGLTFVSDGNVVLQLGAKPIFVDSTSLDDLNVSCEQIISKITPRTKAIVIVHFAGFPAEIRELQEICSQKGIALIEDCAHAPGAALSDIMCGSIADFSFFSFFSNKNIAIGEGGMVFSKCQKLGDKIRLMRSHGMTSVTLQRHLGRAISYDVVFPGLNYRADEIRAALGREQLKKLKKGNQQRKLIYESYSKIFNGTEIRVPFLANGNQAAYHIMPVILPVDANREYVIAKLRHEGIQTSIHYPSFKHFSAYSSYDFYENLGVVDEICSRELTLPLHPRLKLEDTFVIGKALLAAVRNGHT